MNLRYAAFLLMAASTAFSASLSGVADLAGKSVDVFEKAGGVNVLLFLRSDCPISKRYAPELQRIAQEFSRQPVAFWLVFADRSESANEIRSLVDQYEFPGTPIRDEKHVLVERAHATVAPEAAVFDRKGRLIYHGRIDDRYAGVGKARPEAQVHDLEDAVSAALAGKEVRQAVTQAVGCSLADVE